MSRIGQATNPRTGLHERAPRPVVGYAMDYPDGFRTGRHSHPRAQLIYAISGVMRIETDAAGYTIPPGSGLFMPAGVPHEVRMDGTWRCGRCSCAPTPRGPARPAPP